MVSHLTHLDIGLTGQAGSGKDTAAQALVDLGYKRVAFADQVRELALVVNPLVPRRDPLLGHRYYVRLDHLVDDEGWDGAKRHHPEVRRLLEAIGQGVRDVIGAEAWVEAAWRIAEDYHRQGYPCVFTDVRYPNEQWQIPVLIRIERPELGPPTNPSDIVASRMSVPYTIYNGGTTEDLHENLMCLLQEEFPWMTAT